MDDIIVENDMEIVAVGNIKDEAVDIFLPSGDQCARFDVSEEFFDLLGEDGVGLILKMFTTGYCVGSVMAISSNEGLSARITVDEND